MGSEGGIAYLVMEAVALKARKKIAAMAVEHFIL